MPTYYPTVSRTIGTDNQRLALQNDVTDYNIFTNGLLTENFTVVKFSIYSDNLTQLTQPIIIQYIDANGNQRQFSKAPRVDPYQIGNVLNSIEIPKIPANGINKFSYNILPFTKAIIIFEFDRTGTAKDVFLLNKGMRDPLQETVESDMYDGFNDEEIDDMKQRTNVTRILVEKPTLDNNSIYLKLKKPEDLKATRPLNETEVRYYVKNLGLKPKTKTLSEVKKVNKVIDLYTPIIKIKKETEATKNLYKAETPIKKRGRKKKPKLAPVSLWAKPKGKVKR